MLDSILQQLYMRALPPLCPQGAWNARLSREILDADFGNSEMASAIRAGLLLWNDDLPAAHGIVQSPETPIHNFWHAILHRREGDFSNSQYWFRRVGPHPAFDDVYDHYEELETTLELGHISPKLFEDETWHPIEFVRLCEGANEDKTLREIQLIEIEALLNWCRERI